VWLLLMKVIVPTSVMVTATASPIRMTPTMARVSFIQIAVREIKDTGAAALPAKTRCLVAAQNETYIGL
jgi:hypothetical protein